MRLQMSLRMELSESKKALVMSVSILDVLLHILSEVLFSCFLSSTQMKVLNFFLHNSIIHLFGLCSIRGASAAQHVRRLAYDIVYDVILSLYLYKILINPSVGISVAWL